MSIELAQIAVVLSKAVPGAVLITWGVSAAPRWRNHAVSAALFAAFCAVYYLIFSAPPFLYVGPTVLLCLAAALYGLCMFEHEPVSACMLGVSVTLCLQIIQAAAISVVAYAFVDDVETFVASFTAANLLLEPFCAAVCVPFVAIIRSLVPPDEEAFFRPVHLLGMLPPFLVYACISLSQLPNFEENLIELEGTSTAVLLVLAASALMSGIFSLVLFRELRSKYQLGQIEAAINYRYESTAQTQSTEIEMSRVMHDLRNQLACALETVDADARAQHLRQIDESLSNLQFAHYTGNPTLDTVLNQKRRQARALGIDFHLSAEKVGELPMESIDVCAVAGNALDNAIEAAARQPEEASRCVDVKVARRGAYLAMRFANSYEGGLAGCDATSLPSSKRPGGAHGLGLVSIRRSLEKYGGSLSIDADDEEFRLVVLVPMDVETREACG